MVIPLEKFYGIFNEWDNYKWTMLTVQFFKYWRFALDYNRTPDKFDKAKELDWDDEVKEAKRKLKNG